MNFIRKYIYTILLIVIILIGLFLRLKQLTQGDLWLDEAFTGIFIRSSWSEMFRMIITDFVHPPLYYSLAKLWTEIFSSTSPIVIRSFSVVLGTLLIPLAYTSMNKILEGKKRYISLLASLVFAVDPFFVSYSIEARSYALLAVLGILAATVFIDILRAKRVDMNRTYIKFVILSILLISTHYISAIYLLSLGISYLILKPKTLSTIKDMIKLFLPSLIVLVATIGIYIVLRKEFVGASSFNTGNVGWIPQVGILSIPLTMYSFLFGVQAQTMGMLPYNTFKLEFLRPECIGVLIFITLAGYIYYLFTKGKDNTLIYLLCISILPILWVILFSWVGLNMYVERYMIMFGVGLILLSIYTLSYCSKTVISILGLIYVLLVFLIVPVNHTTKYSQICSEVNGNSILVDDPSEYIMFRYYCDKSSIKLYTRNRDFYKDYWLAIGYGNTVDKINKDDQYLIKKTNEVETDSKWKKISDNSKEVFEDLSLYKL